MEIQTFKMERHIFMFTCSSWNANDSIIQIIPYQSETLFLHELILDNMRKDEVTERFDELMKLVHEWLNENGYICGRYYSRYFEGLEMVIKDCYDATRKLMVVYMDCVPVLIIPSVLDFKNTTWGKWLSNQSNVHIYEGDRQEAISLSLGMEQSSELFAPFDLTQPMIWPFTQTIQSAGTNLFFLSTMTLKPGEQIVVGTNVKMIKFYPGTYAQLFPRFRCVMKKISVFPGVIDADYTGELHMILKNDGTEDVVLRPQEPLVQIVFINHHQVNGASRIRGLYDINTCKEIEQ